MDKNKGTSHIELKNDERVVKKVKLTKEEAKFMEEYRFWPFYCSEGIDFKFQADLFARRYPKKEKDKVFIKLAQAYFNGYVIKEPKYYIQFPKWFDFEEKEQYLVVYLDGPWKMSDTLNSLAYDAPHKKQFTLSEIRELQKDKRAKGLILEDLKVKVPNDELEN